MTAQENSMEQNRLRRLREAGDWLLRLQSAERAEDDIGEWLRWCDADAENFSVFQRLQRGWKDLDALKPYARALRSPASEGERETESVGQEAQGSGRHSGSGGMKRARAAWALAAGLGAIAVAIAAFQHRWRSAEDPEPQVAAMRINRAATLPDGSKMILGAQSRVKMDFNGPRRELDLSSGEAFFKVKHDKARPFVVQAGEVSVTAIGTAFDVRRDHENVTITVEEGTVDVSSRAPGRKTTTWRAEAGYQVTYSMRERTASIATVDASAELAWRNGELAYVREPLASVVEDLNRYSTLKIVIEDAKVAELRYTGTAFASSVKDWATGISQIYPVEVSEAASGEIALRSRD